MSTLITNLNLIESCKSDIKSAIENKGVDLTGVSFAGYASAIENIPTGSITEKDVTQGVQISNLNNSASYVGEYAFYKNSYLQTVSLSNCTLINQSAFRFCSNLSSVNVSNCNIIFDGAFEGTGITSFVFIGEYLGSSAFRDCSSLTTVSLSRVGTVNNNTFRGCSSLVSVYLDICTIIGSYAFEGTALPSIELSYIEEIKTRAFYGCTSFSEIWLYSPVVVTLGTNAFNNTLIGAGTGSIYVPYSLLSDYKSATNWSDYESQIYPIGGPTPTSELAFNNGLLYGTVSEIYSGYIEQYNLGIIPDDVTSISLPDCSLIGESAFISHYSLSSLYLPSVTSIQNTAFKYDPLTSIDLPVCEHIGFSAFLGCDLLSISAPLLDDTGSFTFGNNYNLSYVDLPALSIGGQGTFNNCSSLSSVSLPSLSDIGIRMFDHCDLRTITLPAAQQIRISAFNSNSQLSEVYLPGSIFCGLGNVNAFGGTPISSGIGSIYVPWSLVDTYKTRVNWSKYESQIYPIGGYPELSFENGLLYGSASTLTQASWTALGISSADITSIALTSLEGVTGFGVFESCENLLNVNLPYCGSTGAEMFSGCTSLWKVTLPVCSVIEAGTFKGCTALSTITLPLCESIGLLAFAETGLESLTIETPSVCNLSITTAFRNTPIASGTGLIYVPYSLLEDYKVASHWSDYASQILAYDPPVEDLFFDEVTGLVYGTASFIESTYLDVLGIIPEQVSAVSLPNCTYVGSGTFNAHPNLVSVSLPSCTEVFMQGFSGCGQLQEVYLPNCTTLWGQAFFSCNALNSVTLDNCEVVSIGAFRYCYGLSELSLPKASILYGNCFANCSYMNALYLLGSSVVTLSASTAFTSCPATVYVPSSLYESYLTAPVWSTIAGKLAPIE